MTHPLFSYLFISMIGSISVALIGLNVWSLWTERKKPLAGKHLAALTAVVFFSPMSQAHFVFVVPEAGRAEARVILSEDLKPDSDIPAKVVAKTQLSVKLSDGTEVPLQVRTTDDAVTVKIVGDGTRVVHGTDDMGVTQRGSPTPYRLIYHPKTILGDAFDAKTVLGSSQTPLEILPVRGTDHQLAFEVRVHDKPAADAEVNVILPDGNGEKAKTDASGRTHGFTQTGTFGAWVRYFEPGAGEVGGKAYNEVRHYATLVATVGSSDKAVPAAHVTPATPHAPSVGVGRIVSLPQAVSSFGAVACDGWLYIYGGHLAATHSYSTDAVSGEFHRLNLADGKTWQTLPPGPKVQGMNLAAHDGKIYRVGGMEPRNAPGQPADNYSIADVSRFDPATGVWESLPKLPAGRSSHDVAIVGNQLFVLGGWNMEGAKGGNKWLDSMAVVDLSKSPLEWRSVKQPFQRRALIAAVHDGKIFILGGFDADSDASLEVDVFDPKTESWSKGPNLPGNSRNGFAPAACECDGQLFVSVADGSLYRLNDGSHEWTSIATTTPRIVHRLAPWKNEVLVIGGAMGGKNFDLIETVNVMAKAARVDRLEQAKVSSICSAT